MGSGVRFYPGLDELLAAAGVRYFVVDSHAVEHADPRPLFGINAPLYCPSGVAAFGRHPTTSKLVWSNRVGYPADYNYREYYRDIGYELDQHYLEPYQYARGVRTPVGIKYHRITGPGPDKHLYNPDWARDTAERHARDFVDRCRDQAVHHQLADAVPRGARLALRRGAVRPLVVRGPAVDLLYPPRTGPRRAARGRDAGRVPGGAPGPAARDAGAE